MPYFKGKIIQFDFFKVEHLLLGQKFTIHSEKTLLNINDKGDFIWYLGGVKVHIYIKPHFLYSHRTCASGKAVGFFCISASKVAEYSFKLAVTERDKIKSHVNKYSSVLMRFKRTYLAFLSI